MYITRLKNLIQQQGKTFRQAAKAIGMTDSGFHTAVRNNTFKVRDIIAIADWLDIPLQLIFKDEISSYKTISEKYMEFNESDVKYFKTNDEQILFELNNITKKLNNLERRIDEIEQKK